MFTRIAVSALFAGTVAGLIASLLQLIFVQPILLHAELYETGELVHFGEETISAFQDLGGIEIMRDTLSIVFTIMIYTAYAFILIAAIAYSEERGNKVDARQGIIWGIAGFISVHLAPGFSLAPEVPGVAAADVYARQFWWFPTVIAASVAMWLIAFSKNRMMWGLACILLIAPHIIGAPEPSVFEGPVPTELGALFAARAFGVGLAAWVLTGLFAGYFWHKEGQRDHQVAGN